jgi:hypothetical protein
MRETKKSSSFTAIAYVSLFSATIVATFITKSLLVFLGGLAGTVIVARLLAQGIN